MNLKYRETQKRNRAEQSLSAWAHSLSEAELQHELDVLGRKCKSPVYSEGLAGHMLRAVQGEIKARQQVPIAPLRKVADFFRNDCGSEMERLECGHEIHVKQDIYGPTNALRRRCKKCLSEGRTS